MFSPDGTSVVTVSGDQGVRVWRVDGSGGPTVLGRYESAVVAAAFSPEGTRVVTASHDGIAGVWPFVGTLEQLAAYARSMKLPRKLDGAQKKQ